MPSTLGAQPKENTMTTPLVNETTTTTTAPTPQEQAGVLLSQVAGYVGHRTIAIGLRSGIIAALAESATPVSAEDLADRLGYDDFYVSVWCRGALAAGVVRRTDHGFELARHMATLLLAADGPGFVGGLFPLVQQPEMFDRFEQRLGTGERMWWDETSPEWIAGVAATGRPFYSRLVPGGLDQVPGLADRLRAGCRVVDSACGSGLGLVALAEHYPACTVVGIDGDAHSVDAAADTVERAGVAERVSLVCSPLEEMRLDEPVTVVVNNISMHECRDIDAVTRRVRDMLEPGGWFVISDFPFPDNDDTLRSVPGRIMSGIQFFEAQIDDQLLPRTAYDELLTRHGFEDLGNFQLTPVHAVTYGRAPGR